MPRSRPQYPPEFRVEAVRLSKSSGDPIALIAKELGINPQALRNWVAQADVDAGNKSGLTSDERSRLRELERENRKLRETGADQLGGHKDQARPPSPWFDQGLVASRSR